MNLNEIPTTPVEVVAMLEWLHKDNRMWEFRVQGTQVQQRYIGTNTDALRHWQNWDSSGYDVTWWLNAYRDRTR